MATCTEYYYAEDQDGNALPFTAYFDLYSWNGSSWEYVDTKSMPSGSLQSFTLTQGEKYKGIAEAQSGYTTPKPVELTACLKDFRFVYVKDSPEGDILSGDVQPTSQTAGETVDLAVTIKNKGAASGHFTLYYYEGAQLLRHQSAGTLNPGQTIEDIAEIFIMPDRDFTVTVKIYNDTTFQFDDTYNITCYLIGGTEYYVKVGGNDELSGSSWANAWATIDKAARTVPDGSTVHIGFGTYDNEPAGNKIAPQNIGAEGIYYAPETVGSEGGTGTVVIEKNA